MSFNDLIFLLTERAGLMFIYCFQWPYMSLQALNLYFNFGQDKSMTSQ